MKRARVIKTVLLISFKTKSGVKIKNFPPVGLSKALGGSVNQIFFSPGDGRPLGQALFYIWLKNLKVKKLEPAARKREV